jgi:alkanesulfonate monooxygenase SsuD/methylene tetrahydromethanopterin reductase-like flavin-dependent oxidoreductase (luciferase family)
MAKYTGEFALQFVTHLCNHYTVPDLVRLARRGHEKGFAQIWVNDNVRYRGQLVVLTAIAAQVPVRIGTAILVPYFHQPLDLAGSLAALSELTAGREISIGIAQGDLGQAPQHVEIAKPVAMVRETAAFLRRALAGEEIAYGDFPLLCEYYRLNRAGKFRLAFEARAPFAFFGGGNGPQSLGMCGRTMDGVISSGTFIPMLRAGRQAKMLAEADAAARQGQPGKRLRKVCELNVSVSKNREQAIEFPKRQAAHSVLQWEARGFTDEEYDRLGVRREEVLKLKEAFVSGATVEKAAELVSEDIVRACYAAGRPDEVIDQVLALSRSAAELGYDQIAFAKLGPDYDEAIDLLAREVVPALEA